MLTPILADPKDVAIGNLYTDYGLYADWGIHRTEQAQPTPLKSIGLSIADYTGRFINPITGIAKESLASEQSYLIGYGILIGAAILVFWYVRR